MDGLRVNLHDTIALNVTPAPYEKVHTSEEKIDMQAVRSSRQLST